MLVLPDGVHPGTLVLRGGRIAEVQPGRSHLPGAEDCEGDHLIPGLVDLHTDNLERQVQPRASARWPSRSALLAHDAQTAAAGVTTVFDALCLGDLGFDPGRVQTCRDGAADLDALAGTGALRAEHFLHLRCEVPAPDLPGELDALAGHPLVRLVSLMDHSPGYGQYADLDRYVTLRRIGNDLSVADVRRKIESLVERRALLRDRQRRALLERFAGTGIPLASHDDRTEDEVAENHADGIAISEFPVTLVAAEAAAAAGMRVIAGAPNLVRGGSHYGNVDAATLLRAGLVDSLASDYVPAAPLEAAWLCGRAVGIALHEAVAMVSDRPARMVGLTDRGRLAPGLRADLVQVRTVHDLPVARRVWREGERVA
nr:alpha-D-ribose 1-methylphosphonate 5-triphosphate diphosphatase [Roseomonas acroporae]